MLDNLIRVVVEVAQRQYVKNDPMLVPRDRRGGVMPSLRKYDAAKTVYERMQWFGIEDSTLFLELERGKFSARQLEAIDDALVLLWKRALESIKAGRLR